MCFTVFSSQSILFLCFCTIYLVVSSSDSFQQQNHGRNCLPVCFFCVCVCSFWVVLYPDSHSRMSFSMLRGESTVSRSKFLKLRSMLPIRSWRFLASYLIPLSPSFFTILAKIFAIFSWHFFILNLCPRMIGFGHLFLLLLFLFLKDILFPSNSSSLRYYILFTEGAAWNCDKIIHSQMYSPLGILGPGTWITGRCTQKRWKGFI